MSEAAPCDVGRASVEEGDGRQDGGCELLVRIGDCSCFKFELLQDVFPRRLMVAEDRVRLVICRRRLVPVRVRLVSSPAQCVWYVMAASWNIDRCKTVFQ